MTHPVRYLNHTSIEFVLMPSPRLGATGTTEDSALDIRAEKTPRQKFIVPLELCNSLEAR